MSAEQLPDVHVGAWLPAPSGPRYQHRLRTILFEHPQLVARCGLILVDYPTNDPRVPWTSWPYCPGCAPPSGRR